MQLCSSDFPGSDRFKLSCFNKHLCSLCLMRIFLSLLFFFCLSPQLTILSMCWWHSFMSLFLFFSTFLLFCVSDYLSVSQIKSNYFRVNITKTEITLLLLSLSELSVMLPSTPVAKSLEIWWCFSYCVPFCPIHFLNVL